MFYRRPPFRKPTEFPPMPAQQETLGEGPQFQGGGAMQEGQASTPQQMRPSGMPSPGSPPSMPPGSTGTPAQQSQAQRDQMARMKAKRRGQMDALSGMGAP